MPAIQNAETILSRWKRKLNSYWINHFQAHVKVVLYHRVTMLERDTLQLAVTPENFEHHIKWLKSKYSILPADEFAEIILKRKKIPENSLLITFDDGYADNYLEALPILESCKVPALFFIATAGLGTSEEFWWDQIDQFAFSEKELPAEIRIDDNSAISTIDRNKLFNILHDRFKYGSSEQRKFMLDNIKRHFPGFISNRATHRMMTVEELEKLASSLFVCIGAHTVNHVSLAAQPPTVQQYELTESKKKLERIIKKPVNYFAYPYGTTKDFNEQTIQIAKDSGFTFSFVNYHGFTTSAIHPHKIPRILVRNWDIDEYALHLNKSF